MTHDKALLMTSNPKENKEKAQYEIRIPSQYFQHSVAFSQNAASNF